MRCDVRADRRCESHLVGSANEGECALTASVAQIATEVVELGRERVLRGATNVFWLSSGGRG